MFLSLRCTLLVGWLCALSPTFFSCALAYVPAGKWGVTALDGPISMSARLTWSIVPDGTLMEGNVPSNLIAKMDETWGAGPGGKDLTKRPWFPLLSDSFNRWSEVGGISFIYSPYDDAAPWGTLNGVVNKRGDIRVGGKSIDGRLNLLGSSLSPGNGDLVIDTDDMSYFGNSSENHGRFRNLVMHELGHGLGLGHIVSSNAAFLMEPANNPSLSGPQSDDILGLHQLYGDRYEKTFGGAGNNTMATATSLGTIVPGSLKRVGTDAGSSTVIPANATDFVSISNQFDADFFSFKLSTNALASIAVVPVGPSYEHARQGWPSTQWNTAAVSNLSLALFDSSGTQIAFANSAPAGSLELLNNLSLKGNRNYYVRVTGDSYEAQFYQLYVAANQSEGSSTLFGGDFNGDHKVDASDFVVWRNSVGARGPNLAADADGNHVVDANDYLIWKANIGIEIPALLTQGLSADYNRDGQVDTRDFIVWRNSLGATGFNLPADGNYDNKVDQLDYLLWRDAFGQRGVAALGAAQVPAPGGGAFGVLGAAIAGVLLRRRRRRG